MAIEWWAAIQLAYRFRKFEYWLIHDRILEIVDRALEEVGRRPTDPQEESAKKKEIQRREADRDRILTTFQEQLSTRDGQTPPLSTPASGPPPPPSISPESGPPPTKKRRVER